MTLFRFLAVLLMAQSAFASQSLQDKAASFLLMENYQLETNQGFTLQSLDTKCEEAPLAMDCVKYVAGEYASSDTRKKAALACIGNHGTECAQYVAGDYAGSDTRTAAAKSCRNVQSLDCVKYVAGDYAASSTRTAAAKACMNVTGLDCVKYVAGDYAALETRIAAAKILRWTVIRKIFI